MSVGDWLLVAGALLMFVVAVVVHWFFEYDEWGASVSAAIFFVGLALLIAGGIVKAVDDDAKGEPAPSEPAREDCFPYAPGSC